MSGVLKNNFSWSKSRDRSLQECPRQYYYQYYGSWGGWEKQSDERTRELYVLKKLQTRHMWAGDKVHGAIEQVLTALRNGMPAPKAEDLVDRTVRSMRQDFKDSRGGRYRVEPKKACGLFEHAYEVPLDDEVWKETADRVGDCIRTFMGSDVFERLRALPADQWLEVEALNTFPVGGDEVYVKLDLAFRDGDGVVIYDWKTGRGGSGEVALQFACYALYAMDKWDVSAEQVRTIEFNLSLDEVTEHPVSSEVASAAHDYILESIGEMQGLLDDVDANRASEETFPLADDDDVCRYCVFRKLCPKWGNQESGI